MTERKPDASSQPSFAERVAVMETMLVGLDHSSMAQTTKLLLACIREQQAALEFYANERNWEQVFDTADYGSTTAQLPAGLRIEDDGGAKASAVLAKWRIE